MNMFLFVCFYLTRYEQKNISLPVSLQSIFLFGVFSSLSLAVDSVVIIYDFVCWESWLYFSFYHCSCCFCLITWLVSFWCTALVKVFYCSHDRFTVWVKDRVGFTKMTLNHNFFHTVALTKQILCSMRSNNLTEDKFSDEMRLCLSGSRETSRTCKFWFMLNGGTCVNLSNSDLNVRL